jgi:hypothetical protein
MSGCVPGLTVFRALRYLCKRKFTSPVALRLETVVHPHSVRHLGVRELENGRDGR